MHIDAKTQEHLLDEYEIIEPESLQEIFKEQRRELQLVIGNDEGGNYYPLDKIVDALGISKEQLKKKLNGNKVLTRDWLIAICAAFGLDEYESGKALVAGGIPQFDDAINRDRVLVQYLREHSLKKLEHRFKPSKISDVNGVLDEAGLDQLKIQRRNGAYNVKQVSSSYSPFRETRNRLVGILESDGDRYDSLATRYQPDLRCVAVASVEDKVKKTRYFLNAFSDGALFSVPAEENIPPHYYNSLDDTGEFKSFFSDLERLAKREKQRVDNLENDTRNYKQRFSANIKNDSIHVFWEEYNYSMPERNEFYFMEYIDGHYALSVSHESLFMQAYLSEEEYAQHYSSRTRAPFKTYNSIEEIEEAIQSENRSPFYPDLMKSRKRTYIRLQKEVSEKLQMIRDKKIFIQNLHYIFDNAAEVLRYYDIEKEFACKYDEEYKEQIVDYQMCANILDEDGELVSVTFQDVCLAFELGFNDIQQICRIKKIKGSIEAVLK